MTKGMPSQLHPSESGYVCNAIIHVLINLFPSNKQKFRVKSKLGFLKTLSVFFQHQTS